MKTLPLLAAITAVLAVPAAAQTDLPLSAMIAALEAQGYVVTDVDVGRRDIEVDARKADGQPVELRLDPATGAILSETPDD